MKKEEFKYKCGKCGRGINKVYRWDKRWLCEGCWEVESEPSDEPPQFSENEPK